MRTQITILTTIILLFSCGQSQREENKKDPILLADREAPIGWVYLRIYTDSTFEFESRGLRTSTIYKGRAKITTDTIFFMYNDSVPKAGDKAVYLENSIVYTNGKYRERVEIKLNKLYIK
jgi:hypothetical protein